MPKKVEKGDHLGFFNILSVAKLKQIEGGPFGETLFSEKSLAMSKN